MNHISKSIRGLTAGLLVAGLMAGLAVTLGEASAQAASADKSVHLGEARFHRRAVEAAFWGMPTVSVWAMREGFKRDAGAGPNAVAYFSKPMDWKLGVTTPNNSTLYIFSFWNTKKDGPIVIEVPPTTKDVGLFGTAMDAWQRPLIDMGGQGYDKGLGAKYLFLPPGYQDITPKGYVPIKSTTNNGWFLLRTLLKGFSAEHLKKGQAFIKKFRIYPLSQAHKPPPTKFVDGTGIDINGIAPYDDTFFRRPEYHGAGGARGRAGHGCHGNAKIHRH